VSQPRRPSVKAGSSRKGREIFVVCLLSTVALLPLLRGQPPCTHDGRLHFFRVVAMRDALGEGILYSRWLPNLAFGYGFPFFNYRAPLSYYMTLGLHLTGLPLPWALNGVYVLSLIGSAVGAYLLGRDLFGPAAGVVAGVAYAYAPYQLLDGLVRGNAPEVVALAILPAALWAFRRLALSGARRWFTISMVLLISLYLGHNISSLLFTPMLVGYLVLLRAVHRDRFQWRGPALALLASLGLTAFFWLPALAEKDFVQLYLTGATRNNDFHHNFLSLSEILSPPHAFDTSLLNPLLKVRLGSVQSGLAALGLLSSLVAWAMRRSSREMEAVNAPGAAAGLRRAYPAGYWANRLFFASSAVLFVFMSTPASVWIWEHIPLLPFVQFPWRLVGRASLPVALLVGAAVESIARWLGPARRDQGWLRTVTTDLLPPIAVTAIVLATLPNTYPPRGYCPMEPYPTVEDVHRYERNSGLVGVDPVGAYFPIWVQQRPQGSVLETQYARGGEIQRFDVDALPGGAEIVASTYGPNTARVEVASPEAFRARYLSFYFPGWRVTVDGESVDIQPSDPEGLITFRVPAGRHVVRVHFGETPLRLFADVVSGLSFVGALFVTWRWSKPGGNRS